MKHLLSGSDHSRMQVSRMQVYIYNALRKRTGSSTAHVYNWTCFTAVTAISYFDIQLCFYHCCIQLTPTSPAVEKNLGLELQSRCRLMFVASKILHPLVKSTKCFAITCICVGCDFSSYRHTMILYMSN